MDAICRRLSYPASLHGRYLPLKPAVFWLHLYANNHIINYYRLLVNIYLLKENEIVLWEHGVSLCLLYDLNVKSNYAGGQEKWRDMRT